ncbi:MAG: hypothetical protein IGS50_17250 [Synechococcales cyanobacterium C42_A2020_086]|jgi:hypothetical protein|nr:hypothetical protein [Synechococcales cyanobacterium M58_A2018_015]MBF2075489.1 hypothetical protein [Synechococcales cyanobacterium C42_A2020_086]
MTSTTPDPSSAPALQSSIQYSAATVQRADRAVRCTPFRLPLFTTMRWQSVDLRAMIDQTGVERGYTCKPLSEVAVENELLWLIQVGLLRREVDGQGLTNSFRLTPLGHLLVEQWQQQGESLPAATWRDRVVNALSRWGRLPDWLPPV